MALKIRLTRGGSKKRPFYHIVVAEGSMPRDGRFVERLGFYNPMVDHDNPDRLRVDGEKTKAWMAKGAKPTLRVQKMLAKLELCEAPVIRDQPKKSDLKTKAKERLAEQQQKEEDAKAAAEAAAAEAAAEAAAAAEAPAEEAPAEEAPAEEASGEEASGEEAKA